MRFPIFSTILLIVLIQENKANLELGEGRIQEIIGEILQIFFGTAHFENVTCLPIKTTFVNFYLYTPKNKQNAVLLRANKLNDLSLFNSSLETKMMIHGWTDSSGSWSTTAKDEYLRVGNYNIILLDWKMHALNLYSKSVCYIKKIAKVAANLLVRIRNEANLDFKKTHVIGHSLGGQMAGLIGQNVRELTGGEKLYRVTGLDSAGPLFCHPSVSNDDERITADDADYVDAIHTSNTDFGCDIPYGSANFYPNCGKVQAGCGNLNLTIANITGSIQEIFNRASCSHLRAYSYWIESINSNGFKAVPCNICESEISISCERSSTIIMGEYSQPQATGNYYLTTNLSPPYARD